MESEKERVPFRIVAYAEGGEKLQKKNTARKKKKIRERQLL